MHITDSPLPHSPLPLQPARGNTPNSIDYAARQLESQFAQLLIKSMRDTRLGNDLLPNETGLFHEMYDQHLAQTISNGQGLGLAPLISRQLGGELSEPAVSVSAVTNINLTHTKPDNIKSDNIKPNQASDKERFIKKIWPFAQHAARELGVNPRALAAQVILETGWGKHLPRQSNQQSSHNLFGIKASGASNAYWSGRQVKSNTGEYIQGKYQNQSAYFRAYTTPEHSFADYVRLLKTSPRYQAALKAGQNIYQFAQALQRGGYATDPQYAHKVTAIAHDRLFNQTINALTQTGTQLARRD